MTASDDDPLLRLCNASLSNKQWENVKDSLKFGVDADANLPTEYSLREVLPYRIDSLKFGVNADANLPREYSLREVLPYIAFRCCMLAGLPKTTPKQMAAELTRIIKSCNALLTRLDPKNSPNYPVLDDPSLKRLWDLTSPIRGGLETYIAELERWRDELPAVSTKGNYVSNAHNLFWQELARIFDAHVNNDVKFRNRHKIRFLRACTEPFFPEAITDDDGTISAFVERQSARSASSK